MFKIKYFSTFICVHLNELVNGFIYVSGLVEHIYIFFILYGTSETNKFDCLCCYRKQITVITLKTRNLTIFQA